MTNHYYAEVSAGGQVLQVLRVQAEGNDEPVAPLPAADCSILPLEAPVDWSLAPSPTHVYTLVGEEFEWVQTATLAELKASKNLQINQWRLAANRSYFIFNGKQIATDELSALDIASTNGEISLTGAMPANWAGAWKAMDNSYVMIPDVAAWTLFYKTMVQTGLYNFGKAQTLKGALAAATTEAEINAITWS